MNRVGRIWWGMVVVFGLMLGWMVMSWFGDMSRQLFGLLAIMGLVLVVLGGLMMAWMLKGVTLKRDDLQPLSAEVST